MISGTLPNNTIWWLSTNGQKIWIESKELEIHKFKEKGYSVKQDTIVRAGQSVGDLTTSRLESRKRKDAWILKVESAIDVYPELVEDIKKKDIENKKKKKESTSKNRKYVVPKALITRMEPNKEPTKADNVNTTSAETKNVESFNDTVEYRDNDKPKKDCFDINSPYVSWIKDEVAKGVDGKIIVPFPILKEKMGGEFVNMHNLRIFFGLQKILSSVGIKVEQGYRAREHAVVMKKTS